MLKRGHFEPTDIEKPHIPVSTHIQNLLLTATNDPEGHNPLIQILEQTFILPEIVSTSKTVRRSKKVRAAAQRLS